ncbi:hypothetical protein EV201_2187 [Ancylomarina subtilis]|uniref:Uncharacterized protein n=1 Tax=Ancylomarina subtilis TaxID=1639035 RepID=A0A4Q7VMG8_9BACT|nr:hypothetical protein [Ancylomarina subtilis]RZT97516.1 hypothetical protein EV201_2187 [Ancylomarina subtilis]
MKRILIITLLLFSSTIIFSQEKLTNQSIIEFIELGFGSDVIKSKINSSPVKFNTCIEQLKVLKSKGVSSDILALMIEKSKVVVETGLFFNDNDNLKKIEPSVFSGTKTSALAAGLTYGIASAKVKSYIHNAHSSNKLNSKDQSFIFQFDLQNKQNLGSGNWWFKTASSPNEFVLTSLKQKTRKNQRELITGKVSGITASTQMGIDTKNTIPFTIEDLGDGKYKVKPEQNLQPGEYCFFYQGTIPVGGFNNQSIFDFSIQ